ncbi:MAG: MFS transporter [Euzebyales bacterium]|nr:MFS transporter [Euzebyales bacterium]
MAIVTAGQCPAFLTGALAVQIRGDLGFSIAALGLAVGGFFLASAVGSGVLGHLVERLGWRRGMRIAVAASTVSLLGIGAAWSWPSLVAFITLGGMGNAIGQPAANLSLATGVPDDRHGLVFGVKQSAIPMATLIGGLAVPFVALTVGWRWTYVIMAAAAVAATATIPRSRTAQPRAEHGADASTEPDARTVAEPDGTPNAANGTGEGSSPGLTEAIPSLLALALLSVAGGLGAMVGNALGAFLVSSTVASGVGQGTAGLLLAIGSVVGLSMRVLLGWLADRLSVPPLRLMSGLLVLGGVGCLLLTGEQLPTVATGTILGFGAGWAWPGLFNLAVVRSHRTVPALATGITQTGVYVGAAGGPVLFGAVVERSGFGPAWVLTAILALLAAGLTQVVTAVLRADE